MSRINVLRMSVFLAFLLFGCTSKIVVPDIIGTDVESSKIILANENLVPIFEYSYSDEGFEEGIIISTDPIADVRVEKNSKIVVKVSNGPKTVTSKNSLITWSNTYGSEGDIWEFEAPIFNEGFIEIMVKPEINSGYIANWRNYGIATISDNTLKSIPVSFTNFGQWYSIKIPTSDLVEKTPTTISIQLVMDVRETYENVNLEFNISW